MDIYTIIFLALAVFIFLRLRSVLGQRTGAERPPFERAARDALNGQRPAPNGPLAPATGDLAETPAPTADISPAERWKDVAPSGSALARGLDAIAVRDSAFDPKHFLSGARGAYEMIVLAFANRDRRALRELASSDVVDGFETIMKQREANDEKTETRFVAIDKAELVGADQRDSQSLLTVRFVSQMISVTHDRSGAVIDGDPNRVSDITDVWTFARESGSRDPNWKLVRTDGTA